MESDYTKQNYSGGSYSIYYALAVASNELNADHRFVSSFKQKIYITDRNTNRPDFTNTEPAANIGPFPQWGDHKKIVAMDPWGHLAPWLFKDTIENDNGEQRRDIIWIQVMLITFLVDIRPTIAITKAHMKVSDGTTEDSARHTLINYQ